MVQRELQGIPAYGVHTPELAFQSESILMPRYITRRTLQRVLPVHAHTVDNWAKHPDFPRPQKAIGRTYLYDATAVYEWLARHDKADEWEILLMREQEIGA